MQYPRGFSFLQKISMSVMGLLVVLTFVAANLHALLWQSSDWLVSTVLPAVVVQLTNEERANNAAGPLVRNVTLDAAAKLKAEHMAQREYFAHYSPEGVSPWHWFDEVGYVYAHAGENLAIHFTDSSAVVDAWMKSPTHRQNIVNGLYTEIGVGTAKGTFEGYDTVYVVQLFGTPAVAPLPPPVPNQLPESAPLASAEPAVAPQAAPETIVLPAEVPNVPEVAEKALTSLAVESETLRASEEVLLEPVSAPEEVLAVEVVPVLETSTLETLSEDTVGITPADTVVIESTMITHSSGLVAAQLTEPAPTHAGGTAASLATQPNVLLQMIYAALALFVVSLLGISIVIEARRFHFPQVAYGFMLLLGMGGLWFIHSMLTTGAVVV